MAERLVWSRSVMLKSSFFCSGLYTYTTSCLYLWTWTAATACDIQIELDLLIFFFLFKLTNHLITQWVWNKIESHLISSFLQRRMNSKSQGLKIAAYPINCTTQNLKLRWQYKTLQTLHHGDIQTKKSIVTRKFVLPLIILII